MLDAEPISVNLGLIFMPSLVMNTLGIPCGISIASRKFPEGGEG